MKESLSFIVFLFPLCFRDVKKEKYNFGNTTYDLTLDSQKFLSLLLFFLWESYSRHNNPLKESAEEAGQGQEVILCPVLPSTFSMKFIVFHLPPAVSHWITLVFSKE